MSTRSYAPGLKVVDRILLRRRRALPMAGDVVVTKGQAVRPRELIARTELPGDATPMNLARALGVAPKDLASRLLKPIGAEVAEGEPLAATEGFLGYFRKTIASPTSGRMESLSAATGQLMFRSPPRRLDLLAYLAGTVVEVEANEGATIEGDAALAQGIFGIGGEAYGRLTPLVTRPDAAIDRDAISPTHRGQVLLGGARMTGDVVRRAIECGVSAIVSGGMDDQDLRDILGYDLGVAITGTETIGITLVVTEGFGDIAMARRTFDLLASRAGQDCSVNGSTQIRAGVVRPEVLIPHVADAHSNGENRRAGDAIDDDAGELAPGRPVRIIRDPAFGMLGEVVRLPAELHTLESGSKARVLVVRLANGQELIVPRANVERVST